MVWGKVVYSFNDIGNILVQSALTLISMIPHKPRIAINYFIIIINNHGVNSAAITITIIIIVDCGVVSKIDSDDFDMRFTMALYH